MLRSYPCGTAKPRCRGWLHVPMPLAGLVWIVVMLLRGDSLETLLFAFMKSLSYAASVNLHVVPRKFLRTHAVAMWIDCFLIPINAGSYCILVKPGMYNAWAVDLLVMLLCGLGNAYAHWCILHKDQEDPVIKKRMSFLIRACTVGIVMWTTRSYVIHAGVTWGIVVALLLFFPAVGSVWAASWKRGGSSELPWHSETASGKQGGSSELPWHSENWGGHEDGHTLGALMDFILFWSIPA